MFKNIHQSKFKIVFFDIFDTILYRKIQPEYVKKIWANQLIKLLKLNCNALELYNTRNKIEEGFDNL